MNTNRNRSALTRIRSSLRYSWDESVRAHRAMHRLEPYFDQHRQDGR